MDPGANMPARAVGPRRGTLGRPVSRRRASRPVENLLVFTRSKTKGSDPALRWSSDSRFPRSSFHGHWDGGDEIPLRGEGEGGTDAGGGAVCGARLAAVVSPGAAERGPIRGGVVGVRGHVPAG